MENDTSLYQKLIEYSLSPALAMHMPGHKRHIKLAPYLDGLSAGLDITEIEGFDNLHTPQGILKEAQQRAAQLWGAKESFFLVNGSSSGILAAIYATLHRGDEILLARGAHKSVFHAIELCGLIPRFLLPHQLSDSGIFGSVTPELVAQSLDLYPQVRAVLLTSPTYEGVISDIDSIAQICHQRDIVLLIDEAHGAHLGITEAFPHGAVRSGADLIVQSLHKTLPSLTQTAVLHRCGNRIDADRLRHALSVFQTSSPSYLLMASIDGCVSLLLEKPELLSIWRDHLRVFDQEISGLTKIQTMYRAPSLPSDIFAYDPGKILLCAPGCSGNLLMEKLRKEHGIELEMASPRYALAMTGLGDTRESLFKLSKALVTLDKTLPESFPSEDNISMDVETVLYQAPPILSMPPDEALASPRRYVQWTSCVGCISAEYIWAYPPGIPMIIPGERIDGMLSEFLERAAKIPGRLHASYGNPSQGIYIIS